MEDEKTPTTSEAEDVEGHLLRDRTPSERPPADVSSEAPDVELHTLTERPPADVSSEAPDFELHTLTERPPNE